MNPSIRLGLVLSLIFAATVSLLTIGHQAYRIDEAMQVGISQLPMDVLLPELPRNDPHPPAFHLLLKGWMFIFGDSPTATRGLSLLFGLAAIWAIYLLGNRVGGQATGLCAAALLAGSVFFLHYTQTARMYTLFLALTTFSLASLLAYMEEKKPRDLLLFTLNGIALVFTHYLGILELGAEIFLLFVVAIRTPNLSVRRAWLGLMGAAAAPIALIIIFWHKALVAAPERRFPFLVPGSDLEDRFLQMWKTLLMLHTGPPLRGYDATWFSVYSFACIGLAIFGFFAARYWFKERKTQVGLLWGYQLLVWWMVLVILISVNSFYQVRYFMSTLSVHLTLVAFGLVSLARLIAAKKGAFLGNPRAQIALAIPFIFLAASPALFSAHQVWSSREEVPYQQARDILKKEKVGRVIYTGLERIPMGFVMPNTPTLWANTMQGITLALQGTGPRAVVVYTATADRFTPWMRPWLNRISNKAIRLKGSEDDLSLYLFKDQTAFHGARVTPGTLLLPMPGDFRCMGERNDFAITTDSPARIRMTTSCILAQTQRPAEEHPPTDPTEYNKHFNNYLHWAGLPIGPVLKGQRSKVVKFWPIDRLIEPTPGQGGGNYLITQPPATPRDWPSITMGKKTKLVVWFWADKRGEMSTYWRLNYPGQALLEAKLNGEPLYIRLSEEKRDQEFQIKRPGPQSLELVNVTGSIVELQGFEIRKTRAK